LRHHHEAESNANVGHVDGLSNAQSLPRDCSIGESMRPNARPQDLVGPDPASARWPQAMAPKVVALEKTLGIIL